VARSPRLFLEDIAEASEAIARYTISGRDAFEQDPMTRDAVLFRLIVIGQAIKNLGAQGVNLPVLKPEIPWQDAARTRDRLAHHYWGLEAELIWRAIEQLPAFAKAARALVQQLPAPRPAGKRRGRR